MIEKLVKYSMKEIGMADDYIELSKMTSDPTICMKLKEFAKDEIRHYDYLDSILKKEEENLEKSHPESDVHKKILDTYRMMLDDWREEILYKINNPAKK